MATIDNAGNASAALYTPPVKVQVPAQAVTQRPVVETSKAEPGNTASTNQAPDNGMGRFIDTTA